MKDILMHDTLYQENGGFRPTEEQPSGVLLKKRYGSVIYAPDADTRRPGAMYPRCIELHHNGEKNGTLLATFEYYTTKEAEYPIYESTDEGHSWQKIGGVDFKIDGGECRFQPHLYELTEQQGDLPEGTILLAGNLIGSFETGFTTALHLFASRDGGRSFEHLSKIVSCGELVERHGHRMYRPVWEPFLMEGPDHRLYCFYSDERFLGSDHYNQLLAHKCSADGGRTWTKMKIDVAFADDTLRPGMPIIAALPDGKFVMVYEMVNEDRIPVYFRISDDLDDWGSPDFMGNRVVARDGSDLTGTPYVLWIPQGGPEGTILVTGRGFGSIFANSHGGKGYWERLETLIPLDNNRDFAGYSQCLLTVAGGKRILSVVPRDILPDKALIEAAAADIYELV